MVDRVIDLGVERPDLDSSQEIFFDAFGPLDTDRPISTRRPVFKGGDIFEVWATLSSPSDVDLVLRLFCYGNILVPQLLHEFTIPAGVHTIAFDCDIRVLRAQTIAVACSVTDVPSTPGYGLGVTIRIS